MKLHPRTRRHLRDLIQPLAHTCAGWLVMVFLVTVVILFWIALTPTPANP